MKGIKRILSLCLCVVLLSLLMPMQPVEAAPSQAEVDEKIRWIIASIPDACDTDYEKALWLHDYLCKTVIYQKSMADEAYTALINGVADCGGYTEAYRQLLQAVGIQCGSIVGSGGGESHAWNIVILDGKCYFTDVTWDDIDLFDFINYKYFMISLEEMEKDHCASTVLNASLYNLYLPEKCNHTDLAYAYKDTGKPGSGHFNNATTPEEAVKHFKVVGIEGSTLYWQCEFAFDGDAADWVRKAEIQLGKLLGGYTRVQGGRDGYGVLKYECPNSVFTHIDSISFTESTVHLNNSHMRQQLSVSFSPANASYQEVTYSSSDSRIAKVDENGVVRAVSSGTVTITATALDGKTATCQVVVDHQHNAIRAVPETAAKCIHRGNKSHYICDSCGTRFSDSKGKNVVSLMDVVILQTGYCSYKDQDIYRSKEGHWNVCRICGRWGVTQIIPHEDWTGDGICDGFGNSTPCGYNMRTDEPQPTIRPTQPATKPTQPATKPTQPAANPATTPATSSPTTPPATESTPDSVPPATESTPESTPASTLSTQAPTSHATEAPSPEASAPEQPPVLLWIVGGLILVVAGIAITISLKRRKG